MPSIISIIGIVILAFIALAVLRRGFKVVGTLISITLLLALAWLVLTVMGVVPDIRQL